MGATWDLPEERTLSWQVSVPRHNAIRVVVCHRVNSATYWKTPHLRGVERHQNLRERLHILEAGIEPQIVVLPAQNYRHSVVYVRQQRVRSTS